MCFTCLHFYVYDDDNIVGLTLRVGNGGECVCGGGGDIDDDLILTLLLLVLTLLNDTVFNGGNGTELTLPLCILLTDVADDDNGVEQLVNGERDLDLDDNLRNPGGNLFFLLL